jgi:hypothetical protein
MKKREQAPKTEEGFSLQFRPRAKTQVSIEIPGDIVVSLKKIATSRDMSLEALVKLYVGQGLRHDLAKEFSEGALEKTLEV